MGCGVGVVDKLDIVAISIERLLDGDFVGFIITQLDSHHAFALFVAIVSLGCDYEAAITRLALISDTESQSA